MEESWKKILAVLCFILVNLSNSAIEQRLIGGYFQHSQSHQTHKFTSSNFLIFLPSLINFFFAMGYNWKYNLSSFKVPTFQILPTCILTTFANYCMIKGSQMTSYLLVMVASSSKALIVVIVALIYTTKKTQKNKITKEKIWWGLILTLGIFMFFWFDPQKKTKTNETTIIGLIFLFASLLSQGILPQLRAQIKQKLNPQATEIMAQTKLIVVLISLSSLLFESQLWSSIQFMAKHQQFLQLLMIKSVVYSIGQFLFFYLIKSFKQHIVPFIGAFRKILSTFISIILFNHSTGPLQMAGLIIVSFVTFSQVFYEIKNKKSKDSTSNVKKIV